MTKESKALRFIKGSTIGMAVFSLLAVSILGYLYFDGLRQTQKQEEDFQNRMAGFVNPFFINENKVEAEAVLVLDDNSGIVLYAKNENKPLPIASLTKIMSTMVAGQYLEQNEIKTTKIGDVKILAQSDLNFAPGEVWNSEDLLTAMLVSSSNVAAEALFNEVIQSQVANGSENVPISLVAMMNEIARSFGLVDTTYLNSTGLDIKDSSVAGGVSFGGISTAWETAFKAKMLETIFPDLSAKTALKEVELSSLGGTKYRFENTNPLIDRLPITFSKTGYTDASGGSLIIKTKIDERNIYIVVLGATKDGRFLEVEKLYNQSTVLMNDLKNRGVELEDLRERNLIGYGY